MPARLRQAKSDTYVPEPVGFAIPEAKMRVLRTVILAVRFLFAVRRGEECRTQGTCPLCAALLSPAHRKQKTHGQNDRAQHSHFGFGNGKTNRLRHIRI